MFYIESILKSPHSEFYLELRAQLTKTNQKNKTQPTRLEGLQRSWQTQVQMDLSGRPTSDELRVVSRVEPAWLERVFGLRWDALPPKEVPLSFFLVPLFLPKRKARSGLSRFARPGTD